MRTRRQAEVVGACVLVCESAYLLLLISCVVSAAGFDPCLHPEGNLSIYLARAAAAPQALELRRVPHFDVGH